jgi:hypothetical protein
VDVSQLAVAHGVDHWSTAGMLDHGSVHHGLALGAGGIDHVSVAPIPGSICAAGEPIPVVSRDAAASSSILNLPCSACISSSPFITSVVPSSMDLFELGAFIESFQPRSAVPTVEPKSYQSN